MHHFIGRQISDITWETQNTGEYKRVRLYLNSCTFAVRVIMGIIIRQSFKAAVSNYIGVGLGFLSLIYILPYVYEPTELGALRLLTELGAVIGSVGLLGTSYSINRFFPYFKNPPHHNGFFFWAFLLPIIGFVVILGLYLGLEASFFAFFKADPVYIKTIFPMLIFLIAGFMGQTVLETASANHGRIAIPSFFREVWIRLIVIITALLFYLKYIDFSTACWMIVAAYMAALVANFYYLRSLTPLYIRPNFQFLKDNPHIRIDAIKFTGWLFISSTAALFIAKVDFLMVSAQLSLSDTAIYSIGFYIAVLIEIPKRTINQIATPILSQHLKNNERHEVSVLYKQIANNQFFIGSLIFCMIWVNTDLLFHFMPNGHIYESGKYVIFIIGIAKLLEMIMGASSAILHNSDYYAWNFITSILAIASAIGLNIVLIPIYGINGAAFATLTTLFLLYGSMTLIVAIKMQLNPFAKQQIKVCLGLLVGISLGFIQMNETYLVLGALTKSVLIAITYLLLVIFGNVSPEIKKTITTILQKRRN